MTTPRRPLELSLSDCRILRAALATFQKNTRARWRVNATNTHLNCLNCKLAELWPGQAISGAGLEEET